MRMDLDKMVEGVVEAAHTYIDVGPIVTTVLADAGEDEGLAFVAPWSTDYERQVALSTLRKELQERHVTRYVAIAQACVATYSGPRTNDPVVKPTDRPDRKDVVVVIGVETEPVRRTVIRVLEVDRTGDTIKLVERKEMPTVEAAGGGLSDLLDRPIGEEYKRGTVMTVPNGGAGEDMLDALTRNVDRPRLSDVVPKRTLH